MWLENLIELKNKSGYSNRQIAEGTSEPERTIIRIFSGETKYPTISTLIPIINFLGGSFDEIFSDTKAVVGNKNLAALQEKIDVLSAEKDILVADNNILKTQVTTLTARLELSETKLMYSEKLLAVHDYYNKLNQNNTKEGL